MMGCIANDLGLILIVVKKTVTLAKMCIIKLKKGLFQWFLEVFNYVII